MVVEVVGNVKNVKMDGGREGAGQFASAESKLGVSPFTVENCYVRFLSQRQPPSLSQGEPFPAVSPLDVRLPTSIQSRRF